MDKRECEALKEIRTPPTPTNPRYPHFVQSTYTAGDEDQFNTARARQPVLAHQPPIDLELNMFSSIGLPRPSMVYRNGDSRTVSDTFRYVFDKFKKGIFVKISANKLVNFLPFTNDNYYNEFSSSYLKVDRKFGSMASFLVHVAALAGYTNVTEASLNMKPLHQWVPNNAMFRYERSRYEMDNNVETLKDMLTQLVSSRTVPDCEVFINRRDYPLLKRNQTEPYHHIYNSTDKPLLSHAYDTYAPILSGSTNASYADIGIPLYEDWARVRYQSDAVVFPHECRAYPKINRKETAWIEKTEKAVFRGSTTGAGTFSHNNQRLAALDIADRHPDLFDVGITKWNLRPRTYVGDPILRTIERRSYPTVPKLTLQEQTRYKYILHLEGHVAAYRLSYELSSGCVILLADSEWTTWYRFMLEPYVHYVPVEGDLSDLVAKIEWCKLNDTVCRTIAENASAFYDTYLCKDGLLDFLQRTLVDTARTVGSYAYIPNLTEWTCDNELVLLAEYDREYAMQYSDSLARQYRYALKPHHRCVGRLNGTLKVFKTKRESDFTLNRNLFRNKFGTVDLLSVNGFNVVRKTALSDMKRKEHYHEAYIGLMGINTVIGKIPNLCFVYGTLPTTTAEPSSTSAPSPSPSPSIPRDAAVYVEYISGPTLNEWLRSDAFNLRDFIAIILQLNLAITTAQRYIAFIHYDLFPWNVIVQQLSKETQVFYEISDGVRFSVRTKIIPVIIDYGKSRCVVWEKGMNQLIDHGFVNTGRTSRIVDTLTLVLSSLKVIRTRADIVSTIVDGRLSSTAGPFTDTDESNLLAYFRNSLFGHEVPNSELIGKYSKYGTLFNLTSDFRHPTLNPFEFILSLLTKYTHLLPTISLLEQADGDATDFEFKMENGNALQTEMEMFYGNAQQAMLSVITHINRSTRPVSRDKFMRIVMENLLYRRLKSFDMAVAQTGDRFVRQKWAVVRELFAFPQPKLETAHPVHAVAEPPEGIVIDNDTAPSTLARLARSTDVIEGDWLTSWMLCHDFFLLATKPELDKIASTAYYPEFLYFDSYRYFNAIATVNTLHKLFATVYPTSGYE